MRIFAYFILLYSFLLSSFAQEGSGTGISSSNKGAGTSSLVTTTIIGERAEAIATAEEVREVISRFFVGLESPSPVTPVMIEAIESEFKKVSAEKAARERRRMTLNTKPPVKIKEPRGKIMQGPKPTIKMEPLPDDTREGPLKTVATIPPVTSYPPIQSPSMVGNTRSASEGLSPMDDLNQNRASGDEDAQDVASLSQSAKSSPLEVSDDHSAKKRPFENLFKNKSGRATSGYVPRTISGSPRGRMQRPASRKSLLEVLSSSRSVQASAAVEVGK